MSNIEPEVLEAAGFATRYELEAAGGTIIVELVDDVTDEWVVRTARTRICSRRKSSYAGEGTHFAARCAARDLGPARPVEPSKLLPCPKTASRSPGRAVEQVRDRAAKLLDADACYRALTARDARFEASSSSG